MLINILAHAVSTHKRDSLDVRVFAHSIHSLLLPMDDIKDPFRESSLVQKLHQQHTGLRVLLARFHDIGVATDQTQGEHLQGRRGKIKPHPLIQRATLT
jgi:non-ribosomal peptide synthetase component E (peptide arylation enzyme)